MFISLHQDNNYPKNEGLYTEIGGDAALGTTINVPLPPGSGTGCYAYAFSKIVIPALERFKPDMIFVSSGFDASYADPLAAMILTSEAFRDMATQLKAAAGRLCNGRIVFAHEGGYSKDYVPFCALAVIETLVGKRSAVDDPYLEEAQSWGYQALQAHQAALINKVAALHSLQSRLGTGAATEDNVEGQERVEETLADLEVIRQVQALIDAIPDPERRRLVLQSIAI